MFVAPVISPGEPGNRQMVLSMSSERDKTPGREEVEGERESCSLTEGCAERSLTTEGDGTTPCQSPTHVHTTHLESDPQQSESGAERVHPTTAAAAPPMSRSSSTDLVPPTTPCDHRCCSPSSSSDISLFVPNPSTPWAPPPSPIRSNSYRLSSSLPSSPTSQQKRLFRFSMEVQEALFPPFDPSTFSSSPSTAGASTVTLRSTTPKSNNGGQTKSKRRSLRHSCGHNTPLPAFPEDLESHDNCFYDPALWREGPGVGSLDRERFPSPSHFMRRTRSASNPNPTPPAQPAHYTLDLARYSPCSDTHPHKTVGGASAALFKYYTIRPCLNCHLSSSEPNLVALSKCLI